MIYLDYNATTPLDPRVNVSMIKLLETDSHIDKILNPALCWGNPSSSHEYGTLAKAALDVARKQIQSFLKANRTDEILFTSGGTESINHAIIGSCFFAMNQAKRNSDPSDQIPNHIITSAVEHVAVHKTIDYLVEYFGFTKTIIPVDSCGRVNPQDVLAAVTSRTVIISIMLANNEIGTLQPIKEIVELLKSMPKKPLVHTDASQAVGKINVSVANLGVDLLTIAGHKLYGPKGIGALYIRAGVEKVMDTFMHGAGHEQNRRAGTENVLLATGLGTACAIAQADHEQEYLRILALRDQLRELLVDGCKAHSVVCCINGHPTLVLPNTLSISFQGLPSYQILSALQNHVACSAGAACHSDTGLSPTISSVLNAIGLEESLATGTLRLSVGRFTTSEDIKLASTYILQVVVSLAASMKGVFSKSPLKTRLAYLEDSYMCEGDAAVLDVSEVSEQPAFKVVDLDGSMASRNPVTHVVTLDQTWFYPQGGGQPSDIGSIFGQTSEFVVNFVISKNNVVQHFGYYRDINAPLMPNDNVRCVVDAVRRRVFARLHSAGHLLDLAMIRIGYGHLKATKGYHFPDGPSVEYIGSIPAEERNSVKDKLEAELELLIQENGATRVLSMNANQAEGCCITGQAPKSENPDDEFRIVFLGGGKGCPCGGTHVTSTSDIGGVRVRKVAVKKGVTKLSYELVTNNN